MKKFKIRIKSNLLIKIAKLRKEIKAYKKKIIDNVLIEQQYIDKITLLQGDIRELLLKLSKEDRELWLKCKGEKSERDNNKKKRIKG